MKPLDLYATIEPLIGFDTHYEGLYKRYLKELKSLHVKHVLDIGCGNGKLLRHLMDEGFDAEGIERSSAMVERARTLGVKASMRELDSFDDESFDAIVAVADVLNYIPPHELEPFFVQVSRLLKKGGSFLGDINTLYGFEHIADGVMVKEEEGLFLAVEATFEKPLLQTTITLFSKKDTSYTKEQGHITQYFHAQAVFKKIPQLRLSQTHPIALFSDHEADKTLLHFVKTAPKEN